MVKHRSPKAQFSVRVGVGPHMIKWLIPLIVLIIFEGVADIFAKEWSEKRTHILWIGSLASYMFANVFWLFALKNGAGLTKGAIIFSVFSAVLAVFIGLVLYHEQITKIQLLGVVLGLVAITLIFWE